ncbi:hypothetical protein PtB15_16B288 [Puccinia triticina]|nr:hypothetical protein PtB15_16B288 [Puccinia triticina]
MEFMMLELYVQEVEKGKRSDDGFQNTSHRNVAQQLRAAFPETKHLLDYTKCKAKLNQSFKHEYNAFVACKEASRFGWDETMCEVTASDEVWERYVAVSTYDCEEILGIPYPKYWNLDKIFSTLLATGESACLLSQRLQPQSQPADPDTSGEIIRQNSPSNSPTNYVSRSHTKRDLIATAIHGLVGYMNTQREQHSRRLEQRLQAVVTTHLQDAIALYQEVHAPKASQTEQLDAFAVFQDDTNAQMFVSILNKDLRAQWLDQQIDHLRGLIFFKSISLPVFLSKHADLFYSSIKTCC